MSAPCELDIELDRTSAVYKAGERIEGEVIASIPPRRKSFRVTLLLFLRWRTRGRGNLDGGTGAEERLFKGIWEPDEENRYRFVLEAPPGPLTYQGKVLSLDWYLVAEAQIPFVATVQAEQGVVLQQGPTHALQPVPRPRSLLPGEPHTNMGELLTVGGMFTLMGLVLVVGSVLAKLNPCPALFGAALALLGGAMAFAGVRNYVAERKLGPVRARVSAVAHTGGEVTCQLGFAPVVALQLNAIRVRLLGQERATESSPGGEETTHLHDVYEKEVLLESSRGLASQESFERTATFELPAHAPASFDGDANQIVWTLKIHIDIPLWPDWWLDIPIQVLQGSKAPVQVQRSLISVTLQERQRCPYCHDLLAGEKASRLQTCTACRAVFHKDCLRELGSCTTRGCRNSRPGGLRA